MPKTRFTREFQDEAVRLVLTSGRSQRAIADDLGVNRSTLARWMAEHQDTRPSSAAPPHEDVMAELKRLRRENEVLLAHVRSAFRESNSTYGSPRMTRELQDQGLPIGRRRTARLMRENGLKARQKRRFKRTTDSHHAFPIAPNLLEQDFSADRPNQKWNADISYVWTGEGWLYLAVILDLFARRVVGWAVSDRLHKELALEALRKALAIRRPGEGLIHHSDRGSQYCATAYQAELKKHSIRISMSGKGNCYDCENIGAAW